MINYLLGLNDEPTNYELIKDEDDINTAFNIAKEDIEGQRRSRSWLSTSLIMDSIGIT
jgi:hypothetical protein